MMGVGKGGCWGVERCKGWDRRKRWWNRLETRYSVCKTFKERGTW